MAKVIAINGSPCKGGNTMFEGFSERTIDFMWGLKLNNNKPWFEAHKDEFLRYFNEPMKALRDDVFSQISSDYPKHGFITKLARVYKDARRVKDGEPYRPNLWFSIEKPSEEWTSTPVFWFEVAPENWSYGVGFYAAKALTMMKLRARIDKSPVKFERLIAPLDKQDEFVLDGDEYKRAKEAPSDKTAQWYNKKSISLIHMQKIGDELFSPDLTKRIVNGYRFLMPYYDYLVTLDNDPDPRDEN